MSTTPLKIIADAAVSNLSAAHLKFPKGTYTDLTPVVSKTFDIISHDGRGFYTFNHEFNTTNLCVQLLEETGVGEFETAFTSVEITSTTVKMFFATFTLGANYKVIVSSSQS